MNKGNMRFKIARIARGLTQRDLAEDVGMPEHRITAIETGRMTPPKEMQDRLAVVLGKPAIELFT